MPPRPVTSIRLDEDLLDYIDKLRDKDRQSWGSEPGRSETIRRIITSYKVLTTTPLARVLKQLGDVMPLVEKERLSEIKEDVEASEGIGNQLDRGEIDLILKWVREVRNNLDELISYIEGFK